MTHSGRDSQVGFNLEYPTGIKATKLQPFYLDVKLPFSLKLDPGTVKRSELNGSGSAIKPVSGLVKVHGDMSAELKTRQTGWWYYFLMGGAPTTTPAADAVLLVATTIAGTMSLTTQPGNYPANLKMTVAGATTWGTMTVTGTDGLGNVISEVLTWTADGLQTTTKWFKTVNAGGIVTSNFSSGSTLAVAGNAGTYTHVFTLKKTIPCMTNEISKGGFPCTYWGVTLSTMNISIPATEGIAEIKAGLLGKNGEMKALGGGSVPAVLMRLPDQIFMNWNMKFKIDGAVVLMKNAEINLNRNLKDDTSRFGDGSHEALPYHCVNDEREVSGKFNCMFENASYFEKFINLVPASIALLGENWTPSGPYESVLFEMPEVIFAGTDPDISDKGEMQIDVPFTAYSSLGADDELKITMVTTMAEYVKAVW